MFVIKFILFLDHLLFISLISSGRAWELIEPVELDQTSSQVEVTALIDGFQSGQAVQVGYGSGGIKEYAAIPIPLY